MGAGRNPWRFAVLALLVWLAVHAALRATGLFGPAEIRPLILTSFLLLWPTPWLLLNRDERRAIGFGAPRKAWQWLLALLAGAGFAALAFGLCLALYGQSGDNPFVSVRNSFFSGTGVPDVRPELLFLIFTGPAVIFSPIGEELFCRGVISKRVEDLWGERAGVLASAGVFAGLHVLHHGVTYAGGAVGYVGWSGLVWFALLFAVSLLFTALRKAGGTIWLAVVAHAGFNVAMNAGIFTVLN